jgi:hypothetical protein
MTSSSTSPQIAGWKTAADWWAFRPSLIVGGDQAMWVKAVSDFFRPRLLLRYLEPIQTLQREGTYQGEGFSIVAIQCTLVEFLESTVQGVSYRYVRDPRELGPYEYNKSGELFIHFLTTRPPFSADFDQPTAEDFYGGVRCGLLHEAQTKNGWRIHAVSSAGRVVDKSPARIVFRDNFQTAIQTFVDQYCLELPGKPELQEAFLRKFDKLSS